MRHILLLGFLFCSTLFSTEVDSFTLRDPFMQDALQELDAMIQRNFVQALQEANRAHSCEPKVMKTAFHQTIKGVFWSLFEVDIENSEVLDRRTLDRADSIYRDVSLVEGSALYLARLGYLMRVGDFYIGSDKFGHFLETGYDYSNYSSLDEAVKFGEMTERTYFGLTTTGVYSYGDLASNLDGYAFWNRLTQYGKDSYFTCSNRTWTQQNRFTWADYINAAWDEGLNCNYYRNDHITNSVHDRIATLGMTCPVKPGYCQSMLEHYGYLSPRVVTTLCLESL